MSRFLFQALLLVSIMLTLAVWTQAQDQSASTGQDANTAAPAAKAPDADEVLTNLLERRSENPLIEPALPSRPATDDTAIKPATPGIAPDMPNVALKREGTFVISRRARMVRSAGATPWMLVFDADAEGMTDPPMYILPCQKLEVMEKVFAERGDSAVFIVSGRVYVYHKANYIMPTMWKEAPNRGNVEP